MKSKNYISYILELIVQRWVLLFVCLFVCSCGNLYTGEEQYFDPNVDPEVHEEDVPVMVAFSDPYYNILATGRGVGKIDPQDSSFIDKMNPIDKDGNVLENKKPNFFIYAFRRNNPFGFDVTRVDDKEICLVDGSYGLQDVYADANPQEFMKGHGKWAYYNGNGAFVSWRYADEKLFYSSENPKLPYDFFAYIHDGAACGEITRTEDRISFPVRIDGSQDLMCGVAELTPEQIEAIDLMEDAEERQTIKEFHYSAYSGRRNVWPIFQLQHQMAYLKVNLLAGNAHGDPVLVHDIRLDSRTTGTFVVVSKDKKIGATFDDNGIIEQLPLRNVWNGDSIPAKSEDPDADSWEKRHIELHYNEDGTRPPALVAGELLLPPGNDVVLHTWFSNKDTRGEIEHTVLSLKDKIETDMDGYTVKGLVAGRTYNLNLTVYGPKEISIEVKATPWKTGGDIDVDLEDGQEEK